MHACIVSAVTLDLRLASESSFALCDSGSIENTNMTDLFDTATNTSLKLTLFCTSVQSVADSAVAGSVVLSTVTSSAIVDGTGSVLASSIVKLSSCQASCHISCRLRRKPHQLRESLEPLPPSDAYVPMDQFCVQTARLHVCIHMCV